MISRLHGSTVVSLALGLALTGCGGATDNLPRQAVSGEVTLDGKPLPSGSIQFVPESATTATEAGAAIQDGRYAIARDQGPVPGKYVVRIYGSSGQIVQPEDGIPGSVHPMPKELIPLKYNTKTTLSAEVKPEAPNAFDFKLDSK